MEGAVAAGVFGSVSGASESFLRFHDAQECEFLQVIVLRRDLRLPPQECCLVRLVDGSLSLEPDFEFVLGAATGLVEQDFVCTLPHGFAFTGRQELSVFDKCPGKFHCEIGLPRRLLFGCQFVSAILCGQ